jgi:hypothetical protein
MEKAPPTKRPHYYAAFRAEALRLANESRSMLEREDNQRNQSSAAVTCQKAKKDMTVFS